MVEFDIKITGKDLYNYMLAHTYQTPSGILGSSFGALMVVMGFLNGGTVYVIAGAALILYLPWTLYIKSYKQVQNNQVYKESIHYVIDDAGITVSQGAQTQTLEWDKLYKAVSTPRSIILYTSKVTATILPRKQVGEQLGSLIELIATHVPASKMKIRM